MSIYGALFSGVSGLRSQASNMGMISDNISNVNTVGYKGAKAKFQTLVTTQTSTTSYSPGGVQSNIFRDIDRQGLLQASASNSDIAVTGRGFFAVAGTVNSSGAIPTGTDRLFTRAGSFTVDSRGYMVNSAGQYMLGVPTSTAGVPTISSPRVPQLTPVNVGTLTGIAAGTTSLSVGANLPSTDTPSTLTTGVTLSGVLPTYASAAAIAAAADPTGAGAGIVDIGMTLLGDNGTGVVRPIPYVVRLTPTSTGGGTTTTYTATSPNPPNISALVGAASGTLVITNATGVVATDTLAIAASGAVPDPNSTAGGTVTVGAIAAAAITTTGVSGSSTTTPLTQTVAATPSGTGTGSPGNPATRDVSSIVYDSLGVAHTVIIRFTKLKASAATSGGTWHAALQSMNVVTTGVPSTSTALPANLGIIDFNQDGTIASATPQLTAPGLTMSATGAKAFLPTLNFGTVNAANGLTQFSDVFATSFVNQDGVPFGYRTGVSIDKEGLVRAVFDNGQQIPLFKMPITTFANPNGLEPRTGNLYGATIRSGDAVVNFAGVGGAGSISPSTLESSTVDLAEEFTNMIITQRSYSASAKTITTADEMLDEVVRLKR